MSVTIRRAVLQDLPDIIAIEEASFSSPWSHQSLRAEFDNRVARYYVLEGEDGTVAPMPICGSLPTKVNWPTSPSIRRRGASATAKPCCARLWSRFSRCCRSVFLEVRLSNAAAIALYEKLGYEKTAIRKGYYSQPVEDAYIMNCTKENYRWLRHLL